MKNPVILCFIAGMLTGMGNGSVFGATLMCFLGRGKFGDWGGWFGDAYNMSTFTGFIDWSMIIFGIMFFLILYLAMRKHAQLEG